MEEPTTNVERSPITLTTRNVPASYINDGHASSDIIETDTACFIRFSFLRWEHSSQTLTVLLVGVCPNCQSYVLHNMCVQHYYRDVVRPLIDETNPQVTTVKALLSDSILFDSAIDQLGRTITHPDFWSIPQPFHMCTKSFGGIHPFVQEYVKTVIEKTISPPLTPQ